MAEKSQLYVAIGGRIRSARLAAGLTQKQLAEELSVTAQHISDMERGTVGPSVPTVLALCRVLGVSADALLLGK